MVPASTGGTYAGAVRFAAGSASVPSISFDGDTNTGIYSPGADTVGLTAGGTQVGSVGLGTTLALQGATSQSGTGITFPATQSASSARYAKRNHGSLM